MHFGRLHYEGWKCHGFSTVTDVVVQHMLNNLCRAADFDLDDNDDGVT
jgi:hypothetical protein